MSLEPLATFLPATRSWFRERYGEPTPPQSLGWPVIQRGEHTLILSPTGSGKTMAAFLWGIDRIYRDLLENPELSGVQLVYISPLKALNNDIGRNLREPLAGIRLTASQMGQSLPPLHHAVRTGDTPSSARQRMVRRPPHILITTPESLYLILTSVRAREMLASVHTVIVDEIHTLCGNKRGVHLTLSLERLRALTGRPFQRIGLSATQRPLEEVARFLTGQEWTTGKDRSERLVSRQVTIVDAGTQKDLDVRVITAVPDLRRLPHGSIWPSLIPQVLNQVRRHHTTLIFTNGRRGAERAADRLNEQYAQEESEELPPGSPTVLVKDGVPRGQGMFGTGRIGGPFRAHHGSVSREVRLELEEQLKAGQLPALVATSSLELGIDVGQVDAVVQLQSPRGIARGLQRVGRSGHLVGQTSVGRIYPTYLEDVLDAATVAQGMLRGDIEPTHTPQNCLDVLAQQIVAMVAMQEWDVGALHRLVRQAYGYGTLTLAALHSVLRMLSSGYGDDVAREMRPRLVWDRVNDKLAPLPGSRILALRNGGTIADRGEFRVYLPDGKTTLGTLDEEFVYESRPGDVFTLGSSTWRVQKIDEDRIIVSEATGSLPRMPFWHGEAPKREYHMGLRLGTFRRELAARVTDLPPLPDSLDAPWPDEAQPIIRWLADDYALDEASARNAIHYVRRQVDVLGAISSDRTVIVELFQDSLGDQRMAIHCPLGARINSGWALALAHAFRERFGTDIETQVNDDGILFHFAQANAQAPIDLVTSMGPEEVRERLLLELPNAALFGAQFRMNAARALLLPGVVGRQRRTPFWLQRMRARNLLAVTRGLDDFPLIAETYRTCLNDILDLRHTLEFLGAIRSGEVRLVVAETLVPSPVAASLLSEFMAVAMYEGDSPIAERQLHALTVNRELLSQLLDEDLLPDLLRTDALNDVQAELQHLAEGYQARTPDELTVILHDLNDLSTDEVLDRCLGDARAWLLGLAAEDRVFQVDVPTSSGEERRWICADDYWRFRDGLAFPETPPVPIPQQLLEPRRTPDTAMETLVRVLTRTHGPLTREQMLARCAFPQPWLDDKLAELVDSGHLLRGRITPEASEHQWCDRRVLERIHRRTLSLLRKEVEAVDLPAYADFLLRWQGTHPRYQRDGAGGLADAIVQLRGLSAPAVTWERDLLPLRVRDYREAQLDALCEDGDLVWVAQGIDSAHARSRFFLRGEGSLFLPPEVDGETTTLSEDASKVWALIKQEGASFASDLRRGLSLDTRKLDTTLVELLLSGLVTNDHYSAMRLALSERLGQSPSSRGIGSSLDNQLAGWRAERATQGVRRPRNSRLRQARRDLSERLTPPTQWPGRWSLVHRLGVWGLDVGPEERTVRQARLLLQRYGLVTRECLANEEGTWDWGTLYRQLQLMEMRGEIRRGYFVRGLSGVQFALPEAVEELRAWSKPEAEGGEELALVNAWDPSLLYGPALSGRALGLGDAWPEERNPYRFSRLPSNYLVLQRGVPLLLYEHGGHRWVSLPSLDPDLLRRAVILLRQHLTRDGGLCSQPRRLLVEKWDGKPPLGGAGESLLEGLGFRRESLMMVWDGL